MSDILHQLKRKKLTLVVDLDQTIIHTSTTDNIPEGIPGVFHFYLSNKKFRFLGRNNVVIFYFADLVPFYSEEHF